MRSRIRGQSSVFERTAIPHLTDVYRIARQMSDESRASDLVQETYLRAWKYFGTFEQGTNCRAWLLKILHRVWVDQWRQSRLEFPLAEDEDTRIEPYYDWEDEFIKEDFSPSVEQALQRLPEAFRWAVLLADVEELSYQEISKIMNCPIGTVMSRINRGRRTLAGLLRDRTRSDVRDVNHFSDDLIGGRNGL